LKNANHPYLVLKSEGPMDLLESEILSFIDESPSKVTFSRLKERFCRARPIYVKDLRQAIANLISFGTLRYTFHFGRSFIERSFEKPLQVSRRVILKPPRCSVDMIEERVVVSIEKGASFGGGEHPTTRLAIQLIDDALDQPFWQEKQKKCKAIDIGTGSGILAIVAAMLGVNFVIGIDTDPCSIYEAQENILTNQLSDRVQIRNKPLPQIDEKFDLVFANLRTPTLIALRRDLDKKLNEKSLLIFSGIKTEEVDHVCEPYQKMGFRTVENRTEKGWSAISLARG
jgi:ribosomal protein L11 methyltransferase